MPRSRADRLSDAVEPAHALAASGDAPDESQRDGAREAGPPPRSPVHKRAAPGYAREEAAWLEERFDADGGELGMTVGYKANAKATADLAGAVAHWACAIAFGAVPILSFCWHLLLLFHPTQKSNRNELQCTGV